MDNIAMLGLARHALQIIGGALMARGLVDAAGWELIAGAITSASAAAWYLWSRRAK